MSKKASSDKDLIEKTKAQVAEAFKSLKVVNDQIRTARSNGGRVDDLGEALGTQQGVFERLDYLRREVVPEAVSVHWGLRRSEIPGEIQALRDEIDSAVKRLDDELRPSIREVFERLLILGAKISGSGRGLELPPEYARYLEEARAKAGKSPIEDLRRDLRELEDQERQPLNVSRQVEKIFEQGVAIAREEAGFDQLLDYINPKFRGLPLD
jgi:hypothetical protein